MVAFGPDSFAGSITVAVNTLPAVTMPGMSLCISRTRETEENGCKLRCRQEEDSGVSAAIENVRLLGSWHTVDECPLQSGHPDVNASIRGYADSSRPSVTETLSKIATPAEV